MKLKVAFSAAIIIGIIAATSCTSQNQTSVLVIPTAENSEPEETTTLESSQPEETTTAATTTTTPVSSDEATPTTENQSNDKDEYLTELLGDGEVVLDDRADNGFYARMVANGDKLKTYFELPEDTIENGCLLMGHTMYSLLNSAVNDNYTSVSFIFADNREKPIMMYSANYNGTSWTAPIPMSWINTEYEDMWNSLVAGKATSES